MIDIKDLRERPETYKKNNKKRNISEKLINEVLKLDERWRSFRLRTDKLRHERNKISGEINEAKKNKEEKKAKGLIKKAKGIPGKLKELQEKEKIFFTNY